MAIEIIKELLPTMVVQGYYLGEIQNSYSHQTPFLTGYNMHVVKWKTDTVADSVKGKITINGNVFQNLVPDSSGVFSFNIQEVVKALFGNFNDDKDYNVADVLLYDDNLLLKLTTTIEVVVTIDDEETSETSTITAYALRSVHEIGDNNAESMASFDPTVFTSSVYPTQTLNKFDGEIIRSSNYYRQQYLKIFKGYPFSVSIIDKLESTVLRYERLSKDGQSSFATVNRAIDAAAADKYLKRLIISDGESLITPFTVSECVIKVSTQDETAQTQSIYIFEANIVDECGIYLKWLNTEGGWSYFLFNKYYKMPFNVKSKGKINKYLDTLIGATGNQTNIGQTKTTAIKVNQRFLSREEFSHVVEIAASPIVYLYNQGKGTVANADSWLEVSVEDFKDDFRDNKKNIFDISFTFNLPLNYTQSL